ncbi:unnamed protein product [Spirodela intermedia]|uniref:mannan endo-1,4-beta-mannosidase n=1 Tax=Spirodela intermedia TaxID=51605 RepID=A0A7I8ITM9_SPIIN|nr:unnamed protein product [Spirodela intermedia]CAA6661374.1 unnamed protein product [Spirodela intermedia]
MKRAAALLLLLVCLLNQRHLRADAAAFVRVSGLHFTVNGSPFFANGFNAYWLMSVAADTAHRSKVSMAFQEAASHGLTVCRTWAFSDGGYRALQVSPGVYDEQVFRGLDFVVAEASKHGIRLVLSFKQYVSWARARGQNVFSDDDFFSNPLVRFFFKNHVKEEHAHGGMYRDDPTILAWELMNEPRCPSDPSGRTLQSWIEEMAAHVKSIDWNHLLEAGLEGFYGPAAPPQKRFLPGLNVGTDFISNNLVHGVDFATIHSYPDQWLSGSDHQTQLAFLERWLDAHIADARLILRMPLLLAEFGISRKDLGFSAAQRDALLTAVYTKVYRSARAGGSAAGALFWHLLEQGMEVYGDGYEIVFQEIPHRPASIITEQGRRLRYLGKLGARLRNVEKLEKARAMNAQPSRSSVGDGT